MIGLEDQAQTDPYAKYGGSVVTQQPPAQAAQPVQSADPYAKYGGSVAGSRPSSNPNLPSIGPRKDEPIRNWFEDAKADIQYGTASTFIGKLLGHGGSRPGGYDDGGRYQPGAQTGTAPVGDSAAANLIAGPALGPLTAGHGLANIPDHPVKGANEVVRGLSQTAALPLMVANPGFIGEALPYVGAQSVVQAGAKAMGEDDDYAEMIGNLAIPTGVLTAKGLRGVARLAVENPKIADRISNVVGGGEALNLLMQGKPIKAAAAMALSKAMRAVLPSIADADIPNPLTRDSFGNGPAPNTVPKYPKTADAWMSGLQPNTETEVIPPPQESAIPPSVRRRPGQVAPEIIGNPETDSNVLANRQGVRVRPPAQIGGQDEPAGLLPDRTATPLPEQSQSTVEDFLKDRLQGRQIEAVAPSGAQQQGAIMFFLRRNPNATPKQAADFAINFIDKHGVVPDLGGLGQVDTGVNPNTSVGRPIFSQPPKMLREVQAYESLRRVIDELNSNGSEGHAQQEEIQQWIADHNKQPEPFQSNGLKTQPASTQGSFKDPYAAYGGKSEDLSGVLEQSVRDQAKKKLGPNASEDDIAQWISKLNGGSGTKYGWETSNGKTSNWEQSSEVPPERREVPRTKAEILSARQKEVQAQGIIQRAGLNPENFNHELGTFTFSDPTNRSPKVASLPIDELLQGGPQAVRAKMDKVLSEPEPARAGKDVSKQPQQPAGVASGIVPASTLKPGDTAFVDPQQVQLRPQQFQYKSNVNERGVTNQFDGQHFNEDLMGIVHAFKDPSTGELIAVNGHHRVDLAQGDNAPRIRVHVLETSDPQQARALGAIQNIAEGNGTATDAAKYFRDTGTSPTDLKRMGVSLSGAKVSDGMSLAKLDPPIFDKVATGRITEGRGVAIGNATDDPVQQQEIMRMIDRAENRGKTVTDGTVAELSRMVKNAGTKVSQSDTLFGPQSTVSSLAVEKAEVSASIKKQIAQEKRVYGSAANNSAAQTLGKVEGQNIKPEENAKLSQAAAQAMEVYDKLSAYKGPIDTILERSARRLADGENANRVKSDAYESIRQEISKTIPSGQDEINRNGAAGGSSR